MQPQNIEKTHLSHALVTPITYANHLHQHAAPMQKIHVHPSRFVRALITVIIWMMAVFTMASCSTTKKPVSLTSPTQSSTSSTSNTIAVAATPIDIAKEETATLVISQKTPSISAYRRKKQFFAIMKPIVIAENNAILKQRKSIIQRQKRRHLNSHDINTLQHIARQYKSHFPKAPHPKDWQALLRHVDIVPVELALVQAANESAWGTSFFAVQGNNYFGQWCYKKGCGIVPRQRNSGATHEVKRFNSAAESVHAYMKNINTSRAYADLRKIRSNLRKHHVPIHAEILTRGLKHYSERGTAYIKTLRTMIRSNRKLIHQAPSR